MASWRYEISLLVLKKHSKRNFVSPAAMQYPLFICVSYCYLIRFSISSNFFSFIPIRAYLIKFISTCLVYLTLEDGQFGRPKCHLINSSLFPLLAACLFYLL